MDRTLAEKQDELIADILAVLNPQLEGKMILTSEQYKAIRAKIAQYTLALKESGS
jgi:hypothetical protein